MIIRHLILGCCLLLGQTLQQEKGKGSPGQYVALPEQDVTVVTYSSGKSGTPGYEGLSFWIKDNQRAYIRYAHGLDTMDIDLTYKGPMTVKGEKAFIAAFPSGNDEFLITPRENALKIIDGKGKLKIFNWEDERKGTDSTNNCPICPQSEKEAMAWMNDYFFR